MRPGAIRFRRLLDGARLAFDALVPAACVACGRGLEGSALLCPLCTARLPRLPAPRCERCAEPLGRLAAQGPFRRCGACEDWPPALGGADAPFAYEGPAAAAVRALKYGRWHRVAADLASHMRPAAARLLERLSFPVPPVCVPVPIAPARARERGFNQAEALCRALAPALGLPVRDALIRHAGGARQAALPGTWRKVNVAGRFAPAPGRDGGDRPVLLVDDVLTTGATASACAQVLAESGFGRVAVITFARTLRPLDR